MALDTLPTGMVQEKGRVIAHKRIAADHYLLRLKSPVAAKRARAGQFAHLLCGSNRLDSGIYPFLRRPLSLYDADPKKGTFDVIYKVVGLGTAALAEIPVGAKVDFIGPLGLPFGSVRPSTELRANGAATVFLIGGGVGIPPLYFLAKELLARGIRAEVFLGARTRKWVICAADFRRLGLPVHVATDDGTLGRKSSVVDLARELIARTQTLSKAKGKGTKQSGFGRDVRLAICGPTPMMAAAARLAREKGIPAEVSLEERMGCAMGCCMGCVVEVTPEPVGSHARFQRVCTEGPVFPAEAVVWR